MNTEFKCVIVVDDTLSIGEKTNISAILGISLGKKHPEIVGENLIDADGIEHFGVITVPVPTLECNEEKIKEIRNKFIEDEEVYTIDFTNMAKECMTYDDLINRTKGVHSDEIKYLGIALCGNKKKINKATGNISLLK